jgi:signal transduction histidine kinase
MRRSISRQILLLIAIPVAVQLLLGILLVAVSRRAVADRTLEIHSQQVIADAFQLSSLLLGAEAAVRGYIITGRDSFAAAFTAAVHEAPRRVELLRALVSDNPSQLSRVEMMRSHMTRFIEANTVSAGFVAESKAHLAQERVFRSEGGRWMSAFQKQLHDFLEEEQRLARERQTRALRSRNLMGVLVGSAIVLNLLVGAVAATIFVRTIDRRLFIVADNSRLLAAGAELHEPLAGNDEIADVDRAFHGMATSLLRTQHDLTNANRELEAFSYSVSHDLRAPLRAIDGFSRILAEEFGGTLEGEGMRLVGVIRANSRKMADLVDDLLAFSRLTRQPVTSSIINMRALFERAAEEARETATARVVEISIGELPSAPGDARMMYQAVFNLVSNAIKFTTVRDVARISVTASTVDGEHIYAVCDNGVGFDMRYADKLFGVFQRLHHASEYEGTGVGLAIVQRVVQRHGGRVWAESSEGSGATFFFALPRPGGNDAEG